MEIRHYLVRITRVVDSNADVPFAHVCMPGRTRALLATRSVLICTVSHMGKAAKPSEVHNDTDIVLCC